MSTFARSSPQRNILNSSISFNNGSPSSALTESLADRAEKMIAATPRNAASAIKRKELAEGTDPVQVYLRVRPPTDAELKKDLGKSCFSETSETHVTVPAPGESLSESKYMFSHVFKENASQQEVFELTGRKLVESLFEGRNGLLFAYGITGSGKTHTIQGNKEHKGIMPRCLEAVFERIEAIMDADQDLENDVELAPKYEVNVSYLEVYHDDVFDLLAAKPTTDSAKPGFSLTMSSTASAGAKRKPLHVREDANGNITVKGLKAVPIASPEEGESVLEQGQRNRVVAATNINTHSSRSHAIFQIVLTKTTFTRTMDAKTRASRVVPASERASTLFLVDLAGSERQSRTNSSGDRLKEAASINTSLMTLGRCMEALRWNQLHPTHQPRVVPFRNSKMTRLFQGPLCAGTAYMIVNVDRSVSNYDETINCLKYSSIAKDISTVSRVNNGRNLLAAASTPRGLASAAASASSLGSDSMSEQSYNSSLDDSIEMLNAEELKEKVRFLRKRVAESEIRAQEVEAEVRAECGEAMARALAEQEKVSEATSIQSGASILSSQGGVLSSVLDKRARHSIERREERIAALEQRVLEEKERAETELAAKAEEFDRVAHEAGFMREEARQARANWEKEKEHARQLAAQLAEMEEELRALEDAEEERVAKEEEERLAREARRVSGATSPAFKDADAAKERGLLRSLEETQGSLVDAARTIQEVNLDRDRVAREAAEEQRKLAATIGAKNKEIEALSAALKKEKERFSASERRLDELSLALGEKEESVNHLSNELERISAYMNQQTIRLNHCEATLSAREAELREYAARVVVLEARIAEGEVDREREREELAELRSRAGSVRSGAMSVASLGDRENEASEANVESSASMFSARGKMAIQTGNKRTVTSTLPAYMSASGDDHESFNSSLSLSHPNLSHLNNSSIMLNQSQVHHAHHLQSQSGGSQISSHGGSQHGGSQHGSGGSQQSGFNGVNSSLFLSGPGGRRKVVVDNSYHEDKGRSLRNRNY